MAFDLTGVPDIPKVEHNSSFQILKEYMDSLILPLLDLGEKPNVSNNTLSSLTTMYRDQVKTYAKYSFHNLSINWVIHYPHFGFFHDTMIEVDSVHDSFNKIWKHLTVDGYPPRRVK
ncbi:hypothetical protein FIBSPDRAFT_946505 [Athelia psychrophila]|uniref:Uncharacterized protein n=1 Tax=Athelia psychrophila TaxID=1759441 RepID=A0A166SZB3_9AGAM|nr:hypothetical protein FIBSPDRAFT_946505 [Fibularhizoctonia sp. CBS 109695]